MQSTSILSKPPLCCFVRTTDVKSLRALEILLRVLKAGYKKVLELESYVQGRSAHFFASLLCEIVCYEIQN
jgi:hypothetical protein